MKKIINAPETYVDDMLKGIYAAHGDQVKYAEGDLRCYWPTRNPARSPLLPAAAPVTCPCSWAMWATV